MHTGQYKYHYLDLHPDSIKENGHRYTRQALRCLGPASCFAQDDLYTTRFGNIENRDIEQFFFGRIDENGKAAVEYFSEYDHTYYDENGFKNFITYMSVQKLRTLKGLGWLKQTSKTDHQNITLQLLQEYRDLFCALWSECVWQIADSSQSSIKFIISDHPVTVYNRSCFPNSSYCSDFKDPEIWQVATHTYFPLSLEKILILTNLAWVRNPYQNEKRLRPNSSLFRDAMFSFLDIQLWRSLTEQEVLQINYITKMRASRYIAAAEEDWLYPERHLNSTHWSKLGQGWLLMPEPREIHMGGQIYVGYKDGRSESYSEYGHRPEQSGYEDKNRERLESRALRRF